MTLGFRALPSPARAPKELNASLEQHAVSNLCNSTGRAHRVSGALRLMHRGGKTCGPALTVVPPAEAQAVRATVDALLMKERSLPDSIARGTVDRRWVDETPTAKGCIL